MGNLFKGGLFDNSPPQINPDQNLGMGNNNMLPPNSPHAMMSNMHDQSALLKMYEQYNQPSFAQKLSDVGAAFRAAGAAPSQQGALWNQLNQTRANRTSNIRNRFRQLQQDNRQQTLDKQNLRNKQFDQNMATDRFNLSTKQFEFNQDKYNDSQDRIDQKNALIGDNFYYSQGQDGVVNKAIETMDQMGQPKTIYPGDPLYNYYDSALKAKEKALELKQKKAQDKMAGKYAPDGSALTPGQITRDKEFAKQYEKQRPAQASANVAVLEGIANQLMTGTLGKDLDNWFETGISIFDPDGDMGIRKILGRQGLDVQQRVEGIVQQSLRETLGAQFTQTEAFRLISRSYNPGLSPQLNAKRLKMAATVARKLIELNKAKADHFDQYGTLAGHKVDYTTEMKQMEKMLQNLYDETEKSKSSNNTGNRSKGGKTTSGITYSF